MKKSINTFLKIFISLLILYFLIRQVGWTHLINTFSSISLIFLFPIISLKTATFLLNAVNINIFLRGINKNVRYWKVFICTNLAWSVGLFLPGRIGEFSLIYFLKDENITFGESTSTALLDKITTFIVLSSLSIYGIFKYFDNSSALKIGIIVLVFLILGIFIISNEKIRFLIKKYLLKSYSNLFTGFNNSFRTILFQNKKLFLFNLIITILKWFTSFLVIKLIFSSLGYPVSLMDVSYITSISTIFSLIPITLGGLGVRESAAVYLFNFAGVKPEVTLAAYLINTFLNYLFAFILIITNLDKISFEKEKIIIDNSNQINLK